MQGLKIPYGTKSSPSDCSIRYAESLIVQNDSSKVVLPGEFVEVYSKELEHFNGEVSIEPRNDSPLGGQWPERSLTRVIHGSVRIPNLSPDPLHIAKSQQIAQIRRVITPSSGCLPCVPVKPTLIKDDTPLPCNFSDRVAVDPDGQLSVKDRQSFQNINIQFDSVFSPKLGLYNDNSGPLRAHVLIGPVEPPTTKGKLPLYNQGNMQQLQIEADKLDADGILVPPETVGVQVKVVSPSFLVTKPNGDYRLVTAFNNLGRYTRIPPTAGKSCDAVLRCLSSFRYLIKTDLTKSIFQIRLAKSSMPYVGTVTPLKG